jgi:hypothetical protein
MTTSTRQHSKAAIFVDAENHPDVRVPRLMQLLRVLDIVERHAFADWRKRSLDPLSQSLACQGFEMHHAWSGRHPGSQKNTADGHMAHGIMQVLARRPEIQTVVVVSGDAFFAQVTRQLQCRGKQVVVAADPFRVSKELCSVADEYLPVGRWAQWVRGLDHLERTNEFLTFGFVVQRSKITPEYLKKMLKKGLLIQKEVFRPYRGIGREISLNRHARIVEAVLGAAGCINPVSSRMAA